MVADQLVGREVIRGVRMRIKGDEARSDKNEQAMYEPGPDVSTPSRNFASRAWRLYHGQWMVIMDSFLPPHPAWVFSDRGPRSPTLWSEVRDYTKGELSTLRGPQGSTCSPHFEVSRGRSRGRERVEPVYGTNRSGAPFNA